jgi:hypothetical protein
MRRDGEEGGCSVRFSGHMNKPSPFVGVNCVLLTQTETIKVKRSRKEVWLPKSQICYNGDTGQINIDVPLWLAYKHGFPVSYSACTPQGQAHNDQHGIGPSYGLTLKQHKRNPLEEEINTFSKLPYT